MSYDLDRINGPGATQETAAKRAANAEAIDAHDAEVRAAVATAERESGYVSPGDVQEVQTTGSLRKMTKGVLAAMDAERGR